MMVCAPPENVTELHRHWFHLIVLHPTEFSNKIFLQTKIIGSPGSILTSRVCYQHKQIMNGKLFAKEDILQDIVD